MTGHELDRWKEYHAVEPLPDPTWSAAQICAVLANCHRTKGPSHKTSDFMPRSVPAKRPRMTPEEMMRAFRSITKDCK